MVVVTVIGSTAEILPARLVDPPLSRHAGQRSGGRALIDDPHRVAELRSVHDSGLSAGAALALAAQLAGDRARRVDVHALADQRSAVAAGAALRSRQALVQA